MVETDANSTLKSPEIKLSITSIHVHRNLFVTGNPSFATSSEFHFVVSRTLQTYICLFIALLILFIFARSFMRSSIPAANLFHPGSPEASSPARKWRESLIISGTRVRVSAHRQSCVALCCCICLALGAEYIHVENASWVGEKNKVNPTDVHVLSVITGYMRRKKLLKPN